MGNDLLVEKNVESNILKGHSSSFEPRPILRSRTLGDITNGSPSPVNRRRTSLWTTDSQTEKLSMRDSVDDLLLPITSTPTRNSGSSHFHSTPLIFAVVPALGGILFDGGSVVLTDICIIVLACIFLNWSLRLPWDWYHSAQAIVTDNELSSEDGSPNDSAIDEDTDASERNRSEPVPSKQKPPKDNILHNSAVRELNHYQLIALICCFAGPLLGALLLHSIREQLSRPSEGLISNFNLGIFVLAAELRPTQHVFKLVQARILYLQRTVAKNPYLPTDLDSPALADIKIRLSELEAHLVHRVEQTTTISQQSTLTSLQKSIQPELDALNRAVRRYEKRSLALEMQVRAELLDHDQRIKDALALAAAVTRHKKGNFMLMLDFLAAVVVLPIQAVIAITWTVIEVPRVVVKGSYEGLDRILGGRPEWVFGRKAVVQQKRDSGRRKRKE